MVIRRPVTMVSGEQRELPAGDVVGGLENILPTLGDITTDFGMLGATSHPVLCYGTGAYSAAATPTVWLHRCWVPAGVAISNVHVAVSAAGAGAVGSGVNGMAVYEVSGTTASLAWSDVSDNTFWTSTGWRTKTGVGIAAQSTGRFVYLAGAASHATTPPSLVLGRAGGQTAILTLKVDGTTRNLMSYYFAGTSFPSTVNLVTATRDNNIALTGFS